MMKHEWRKKEKAIYLPKVKPELVYVPTYNFITLSGEGNPNSEHFSECIGALYALAYTIKMSMKKMEDLPQDYTDWTVYPLEGVWDISDEAKKHYNGVLNKDELVFDLMIRQPDFLTQAIFNDMLALAKAKKPHPLLNHIQFRQITEGPCVQMMHIGSYDDEPRSFSLMEDFADSQKVVRLSKVHREIYLSDFRKIAVDKLKTVLRFQLAD